MWAGLSIIVLLHCLTVDFLLCFSKQERASGSKETIFSTLTVGKILSKPESIIMINPFTWKKKMYISLPTYTLLEVKKYLKEMHLTKQSIKFSSTTSAWSELIVTDMLSGSHDNNIQNNIMLKQRRQSGYE